MLLTVPAFAAEAAKQAGSTFRAAAAGVNATTQAAANATAKAAETVIPMTSLDQGMGSAVPGVGWGGYFQALAILFGLLGVLAAGMWLIKRYGGRAGLRGFGRGNLRLEGQLAIGPKKNIVVVRFLNKRMVLGVTDSNINLLTELDDDDDASKEAFRGALDKARQEGDPM